MDRTRASIEKVISQKLFDACIDCLYEYDLGEDLPSHWPLYIRGAITAARNRINRHHVPRYGKALPRRMR
jgi:hypothetical protein